MKRTQINGKISHVHRLEELMLLKCPSTQSNTHTDCIRSLSKFQWYFHSNRKSNTVDDMPVEPSKTKYPKQLRSNRSTALPHFRLLPSYSNPTSMALARRRARRPTKQNEEPEQTRAHSHPIFDKDVKNTQWERHPPEQSQKPDMHTQKNETGPLPYTTYKNQPKMN